MIEYRNLYWDAPDHSRMQAEIKHPDFGCIPYCCMESDTGIGAASAAGIIDRLIAEGAVLYS